MLTLNDGRSELWQWDTGRKLTVDADCSQVHFSNKVFGRSIDVDVVDGVASIPDILLQTDKDLNAWAFVGTPENGYTKISKTFKVNRRNKPADYVFTPPEQNTLAEIMERLDDLEAAQDPDAIKNAVEDYLEKNPFEAPVQSVNEKTGKVNLTAKDVGALPKDASVVKTVNGTAPDSSGNVEITIPDSGGNSECTEKITEQIVYDSDFSIDGFCRPAPKNGELFGTNTGYARTDYIDISAYDSLTIHVRPRTDSVSPCVWFDADKTYISGEVAEVLAESDYTYEVPDGAVYAIFSSEKTVVNDRTVFGTKTVSLSEVLDQLEKLSYLQSVCYISPKGSDDNDGLVADTPVLTLDRARELLAPDGELIFLEGDYSNFSYVLSSFSKVSAIGNARLVYHTKKFAEATLVEGYTRVYASPYTGSYSDYLWQMDVPDANTAISPEERHPLQRNRTHRLEHSRMYPVTKFDTASADLAGYLATMEATADKWMYYMDGTNCYFTVPDADFASHPVIIPSKTTLKASEKKQVHISGLKIYFASILTTNLSGVLDGLTVGYQTASGAIMWDNTFGLTLNNCEAVASTNDGINGHDAGDITCYNCWGHDNADDGESDHEKCHIIQYGGLYEYNGNGCTPASGASGEYINTICRSNGAWDWVSDPAGTGFSAQNTSTTDPALMYCIGCMSSGNKIGFCQKTTSKATFVNCVSSNDVTAFGAGTQINCMVEEERLRYTSEQWTFELEDGSTVSKQVVVMV